MDIYKQMGANKVEAHPKFHNASDHTPMRIQYYRLTSGRAYPVVLWYCKVCGMTLQTRSTTSAFWQTTCGMGTFRFELRFASRCLQAIKRKAGQLKSNQDLARKVLQHAEEARKKMEHVIDQIQRRRRRLEAEEEQ